MSFQIGGFDLPFFAIGCAMILVLFCTLSSDCRFRSDDSSDQREALFPIIESLKIPAVSMLGESIVHLLCVL